MKAFTPSNPRGERYGFAAYVFFFPVWIAQDSIQVHIGVLDDDGEYVVINRWGKVSERLERLLTPADRREIESKISDLVREESEYRRWEHLAPNAVRA